MKQSLKILTFRMCGFTLIELTVVILILAIVAVMINGVLSQAFNAYSTSDVVNEAAWQNRLTLEKFTIDVLPLSSSAITSASTTQLVFTDTRGASVNYSINANTLTRNAIVLGNSIDNANSSFAYYDKNLNSLSSPVSALNLPLIQYIRIIVKYSKTTSNISFQTMIALRNT